MIIQTQPISDKTAAEIKDAAHYLMTCTDAEFDAWMQQTWRLLGKPERWTEPATDGYDPEPVDEIERNWWAAQDSEGGMCEGESDRSAIEGWTVDAWTYRNEQMERASREQERIEGGTACW